MIWKTVFIMLAVGALVDSSGFGNMCRMYGLDEVADEVGKNVDDAIECMSSLIDFGDVSKDFSDGIRTRAIVPVIQKYCVKALNLKACIDQLYAAAGICLRPFIQENIDGVNKATKDIVDFICYNDGERINSLLAEGGMDCIVDNIDEQLACIDTHNFEYPQSHEENCRLFADIQRCIISTLETCATPSAANLAKSFFRMIKKSHTCPVKIVLYMGIA